MRSANIFFYGGVNHRQYSDDDDDNYDNVLQVQITVWRNSGV